VIGGLATAGLTTNVEERLPVRPRRERRQAQVLLNLVGKANKFAKKGEVAIEATQSNPAFNVIVRGSGPEVDPALHSILIIAVSSFALRNIGVAPWCEPVEIVSEQFSDLVLKS
jgi:hypothetical protein